MAKTRKCFFRTHLSSKEGVTRPYPEYRDVHKTLSNRHQDKSCCVSHVMSLK
jgi:hypothetical protein